MESNCKQRSFCRGGGILFGKFGGRLYQKPADTVAGETWQEHDLTNKKRVTKRKQWYSINLSFFLRVSGKVKRKHMIHMMAALGSQKCSFRVYKSVPSQRKAPRYWNVIVALASVHPYSWLHCKGDWPESASGDSFIGIEKACPRSCPRRGVNISSNNVALSGQNCNVFVNRLPAICWMQMARLPRWVSRGQFNCIFDTCRLVSCKVPIYHDIANFIPNSNFGKFIAQKLFLGNPSVAVCVCSVPLCQSYFASASASSPSPSYPSSASASLCATQDTSSSMPFRHTGTDETGNHKDSHQISSDACDVNLGL